MIFCHRGIAATVAAALVFLAGGGARAQDAGDQREADTAPARARAQTLLERGNDLFRAGSFAEALRAYSDAHREFPSPKIFFNIARCEESLGHRPQAMESLESFLKQAPDADPQVRAEAQRLRAELAATLATVDVSGLPPNAKLAVDAETIGLTPLERPLWLEPGQHRVSVDRPGRPLWVTTLDGKAGTLTTLKLPEADAEPGLHGGDPGGPGPALPGEPPSEPSFLRRTWWIWAAVVAAGAATLIVLKLRECPATMCK